MKNVFVFRSLFLFLIGIIILMGYCKGEIKLAWAIVGLVVLGFFNLVLIEADREDGKLVG